MKQFIKANKNQINKDKGAGGGPKDAKPSEKDNVVDADFEDVKEDKEKAPKIKNKETSCG